MPKPPDAGPSAGGAAAALNSLRFAASRAGPLAAMQLLRQVNQPGGFDCPGCAWPEPANRASLEFCENGAKHVAHEATRSRVGPEFFESHTLDELLSRSDQWLEAQGRITRPFLKARGADRYAPISWDDAFARIARHLRELASPDEAVLYTSGRTSNEAAFLWQLFARELGTNNLPDCSNLCHESSGTALSDTIGVGKGTVGLADFEKADAIFVIGQNPGTNHPRMLTTLLEAKARGARIVSINPLRERALVRFAHPKDPIAMLRGGRAISDLYVQVRVGGDVALLKAVMKELLEMERVAPGSVLDLDFLRRHTEGFEEFRAALDAEPWEVLLEESGISGPDVRKLAALYAESQRVIVCWCMGLTQHPHAVANVQEIVNLLLLRGNIGTPGAGPCPVRGHSNVQGDRTMGVTSRPSPGFLDRLGTEFGFAPPRAEGLDSVAAIHALYEGRAKVFLSMGGNFAVATPDAEVTHAALRRAELTVQISTTLNRSHLVCGEEALMLPCLGRTERDEQAGGLQLVTVENSMSVVHPSRGSREPASPELRSEPAIVAGMARATLGEKSAVPWEELASDYDRIRERIARVVPGCEDMNRRVRRPGGFVLASGARTRHFDTPSGRAHFRVHPVPRSRLEPGQLTLMTIRSHDQFNTTVYSPDDRYRGVKGDRRVLLLNPDDLEERGLVAGQRVDVTSHFGGRARTVHGFAAMPYDVPRRCAAAYFPEANALVPVESVADKSRTPTYKNVVVSLAPARSAS